MLKDNIILKFGGHVLNSLSDMKNAANIIIKHKHERNVLVVVSAQGDTTDHLNQICELYNFANCADNNINSQAARDFVLATGEQVSAGLLSLILSNKNVQSVPVNAYQAPIHYQHNGSIDISTSYLNSLIKQNIIPIITGFQAIDHSNNLHTLARGGSDITAVVLAKLFNTECWMYKNVCGVYDCDPQIHSDAKHLPFLSYQKLFELIEQGAQIVQKDAAQLAMEASIKLTILSPLDEYKRTIIAC